MGLRWDKLVNWVLNRQFRELDRAPPEVGKETQHTRAFPGASYWPV